MVEVLVIRAKKMQLMDGGILKAAKFRGFTCNKHVTTSVRIVFCCIQGGGFNGPAPRSVLGEPAFLTLQRLEPQLLAGSIQTSGDHRIDGCNHHH